MKKIMMVVAMVVSISAQATGTCDSTGFKITNTGNRGAHFDVNGGMRNGGLTVLYPTRQQTEFTNGATSFKPGNVIVFSGQTTPNGMCQPVGKVTVIGQ